MKKILCISLFTALTMVSCKQELQPQESIPSDQTATAVTDNAAAPSAVSTPGAQVTPSVPQQQSMPTQAAPQAPARVAAGMNPPHGQPGHRCDIAVGAPLNSAAPKPAANNNVTMTPARTSAPTSAAPALLNPGAAAPATVTAPGMNPPHGQPGHRCDIAVGAPLPKA